MITDTAAVPAMAGSANEFVRPSTDSRFAASLWSAEEDAAIIAGLTGGLSKVEIAERMPGRTLSGIDHRARRLSDQGLIPHATQVPQLAEVIGCRQLLVRMLQYGVNRPKLQGLPGLDTKSFRDLCCQHGVVAPRPSSTHKGN